MKPVNIIFIAAALAASSAQAQQQSLAASLDIQVFPAKGQSANKQSEDEASCYQWAVTNTGVDPSDVEKQQQATQDQAQADQAAVAQSGAGAGVGGAVRGGAAGALVGAIAGGDAGKAAVWGASAGIVTSRHRARKGKADASENISASAAQSAQVSQEQITNFKNAFSACLQGKNYIAKF